MMAPNMRSVVAQVTSGGGRSVLSRRDFSSCRCSCGKGEKEPSLRSLFADIGSVAVIGLGIESYGRYLVNKSEKEMERKKMKMKLE